MVLVSGFVDAISLRNLIDCFESILFKVFFAKEFCLFYRDQIFFSDFLCFFFGLAFRILRWWCGGSNDLDIVLLPAGCCLVFHRAFLFLFRRNRSNQDDASRFFYGCSTKTVSIALLHSSCCACSKTALVFYFNLN